MAVIEAIRQAANDSGQRGNTGERSASITYSVRTEYPTDDQQVVLEYFRTSAKVGGGALYLWSRYNWGASGVDDGELVDRRSQDAAMFCSKIQATRVESTLWTVQLEFEPPTNPDNDGEDPEGDPYKFANKISISTQQMQVPVEYARYLGGFTGEQAKIYDDKLIDEDMEDILEDQPVGNRRLFTQFYTPPVNSLNQLYKPALEKTKSFFVITYEVCAEEYPTQLGDALDTVNSREFILKSFGKEYIVPAGDAIWRGANASLELFRKEDEGVCIFHPYWKISYTFHVSSDGWVVHIADEGRLTRYDKYQVDYRELVSSVPWKWEDIRDKPGFEPGTQKLKDWEDAQRGMMERHFAAEGKAMYQYHKNPMGEIIIEPLLLNGDGVALQGTPQVAGGANNFQFDPVYISWGIYPVYDFNHII